MQLKRDPLPYANGKLALFSDPVGGHARGLGGALRRVQSPALAVCFLQARGHRERRYVRNVGLTSARVMKMYQMQCIRKMYTCMPGLAVQNYATYPSMPGALSSIMPGFWWRDNGHKALCPLSIDPVPLRGQVGGRDCVRDLRMTYEHERPQESVQVSGFI